MLKKLEERKRQREMQPNYNTSSWSSNNETNVEKTSRDAEPTKKKKKKKKKKNRKKKN